MALLETSQMIIVEHNGETYRIRFQFDRREKESTCFIEARVEGGRWAGIAQATVRRYFKDRPDDREARKWALKRALEGVFLYRDTRRKFWKAYLGRKTDGGIADSGTAATDSCASAG